MRRELRRPARVRGHESQGTGPRAAEKLCYFAREMTRYRSVQVVLKRYMMAAAAVATVGLVGCGEQIDQILIPIPDETLDETLVDFSGGSITEPSAFDVIAGQGVRTDQLEGWDFVLDMPSEGGTLLWPRSALTDDDADSGLQHVPTTFEGLEEAPESGYVLTEAVAIQVGDVLAVRSRRDPVFGNVRCRRFAKIEVLEIDGSVGTMSFRFLVNPNCEKRKLVLGAEE